MADVLICNDWDASTATCSATSIVQDVALFSTEYQEYADLLMNGGFSVEAFEIGFAGTISVWAVGLAVGLIVAQLRKLKP